MKPWLAHTSRPLYYNGARISYAGHKMKDQAFGWQFKKSLATPWVLPIDAGAGFGTVSPYRVVGRFSSA